jgi:hypothetical protein
MTYHSRFLVNYVIKHKSYFLGAETMESALKQMKSYVDDKDCQWIEISDTQDGIIYNKDKVKDMLMTLLLE